MCVCVSVCVYAVRAHDYFVRMNLNIIKYFDSVYIVAHNIRPLAI